MTERCQNVKMAKFAAALERLLPRTKTLFLFGNKYVSQTEEAQIRRVFIPVALQAIRDAECAALSSSP